MFRLHRVILVLVATLALTPALVLPASAAGVTCGSTLTVDTTLTADLVCPVGPALRVDGSITLDLRSFTVRGPGSGTGIAVQRDVKLHLVGGEVRGWSKAVEFVGTPPDPSTGWIDVARTTFSHNGVGLDLTNGALYGASGYVSKAAFVDNKVGLDVAYFGFATVGSSKFALNEIGLRTNTSEVHLDQSSFTGNRVALSTAWSEVDTTGATFTANKTAVLLQYQSHLILTDSALTANDRGIDSTGVTDYDRNNGLRVYRTAFTLNGTAVNLLGDRGELTGNTFSGNRVAVVQAGSSTETDHGGIAYTDNTFTLNGDALRLVGADTATQLRRNKATLNTGWGLYAPGVTDLGGNTARANGRSPQCTGVRC